MPRGTNFLVSVNDKKMNAQEFAQHMRLSESAFFGRWSIGRKEGFSDEEILINIARQRGESLQGITLISAHERRTRKKTRQNWAKNIVENNSSSIKQSVLENLPQEINVFGYSETLQWWKNKSGVSDQEIYDRLGSGWTIENAVAYPSSVTKKELNNPPNWLNAPVIKENSAEKLLDTISQIEYLLHSKNSSQVSRKLNVLRKIVFETFDFEG